MIFRKLPHGYPHFGKASSDHLSPALVKPPLVTAASSGHRGALLTICIHDPRRVWEGSKLRWPSFLQVLINYNKWLIGWFHRPLDIWKVLSSATLQGQLDFPGGYDRWSMPWHRWNLPGKDPITKWGCPKIVLPKMSWFINQFPIFRPQNMFCICQAQRGVSVHRNKDR